MKRSIHLLIIDPQNDFCDLPLVYQGSEFDATAKAPVPVAPALPVAGAHAIFYLPHADPRACGEPNSRGGQDVNRSLRKVAVVAALLFFSLLVNLTFSYVARSDST